MCAGLCKISLFASSKFEDCLLTDESFTKYLVQVFAKEDGVVLFVVFPLSWGDFLMLYPLSLLYAQKLILCFSVPSN